MLRLREEFRIFKVSRFYQWDLFKSRTAKHLTFPHPVWVPGIYQRKTDSHATPLALQMCIPLTNANAQRLRQKASSHDRRRTRDLSSVDCHELSMGRSVSSTTRSSPAAGFPQSALSIRCSWRHRSPPHASDVFPEPPSARGRSILSRYGDVASQIVRSSNVMSSSASSRENAANPA